MAAQRSAPLRSGRRTMMGGFINWKGFKVSIFYKSTVVGDNTYSICTKMGARIHRTVALLRVCE